MSEEVKDVKQEEVDTSPEPSTGEKTPDTPVSEDVKTQPSDSEKYQNALTAMRKEREAKREAEAKYAELQKRVEELESSRQYDHLDDVNQSDPRVDLMFEMNRDPFVKENLDLIEQKMTENPSLDVRAAAREIKAELFDRIQTVSEPAKPNLPPKTEKPTASNEPEPASAPTIKDVLSGNTDGINPMQAEAIRRAYGK